MNISSGFFGFKTFFYRLNVWDPSNPKRTWQIKIGQSQKIFFGGKKVSTVNWSCDGMTDGWGKTPRTTLGGDTKIWHVTFYPTGIKEDSRSICSRSSPVVTGTIFWTTGATVTDPDRSKEKLSTLITKKDG